MLRPLLVIYKKSKRIIFQYTNALDLKDYLQMLLEILNQLHKWAPDQLFLLMICPCCIYFNFLSHIIKFVFKNLLFYSYPAAIKYHSLDLPKQKLTKRNVYIIQKNNQRLKNYIYEKFQIKKLFSKKIIC